MKEWEVMIGSRCVGRFRAKDDRAALLAYANKQNHGVGTDLERVEHLINSGVTAVVRARGAQ